ncbi:DNA translocase FtsK [Virgibacillus ihumii]|uniref:DNA translocase FtsK n=1 Tax=Virgibacillus ihumii TaxID=2686091 RepID=UPI00157C2ADA|nr:DNA translocase FtsK [Virgibacillus ihumii]
MWDQFKKKINNFLFVETEETEQTEVKPRRKIEHRSDNIQAKMKYQYPEKKSFRFPVIPDQPKEEKTSDIPAYARKKKRRSVPETHEQNTPHKQRDKEQDDFYSKKPFEPTPVPSPIYGFQERRKEKETENVPAYQRKHRVGEIIEETAETEAAATNTYADERVQSDQENNVNSEQKQAVTEKLKQESVQEPVQEFVQEPVQESAPKLDAKPDGDPVPASKHNANSKQKTKKRFDRKKKNKKDGDQKPLPFNVMMSANDKRRHRERKPKFETNVSPAPSVPEKKYPSIPYHLLNDPVAKTEKDQLWMQEMKDLLEKTLKHFNVRAKVVNTTQGPSVTRFEVQPEMGVKVSKVKNLSDDLKLNMAAKDIRIEAPIPGKNTIGIEIPNRKPQIVGLQEIFESDVFQHDTSPLSVGLGLSIEGSPMITNIQKMPHGLIAGATGSGKSVCINTILISMLYKASHNDVKFLLIDPKMVELAPYNGIPHLISPVITDVKAATAALKWAVKEMEERYDKFVTEGVRDVERYNQKMARQNRMDEKLPFMVIVIDELADLMMVSPQDVEDAICRIAQKARACGIHLLLATQRPSVDVITGLIKANIPTRIAFSVSSQVDSRTIMDTSGAEKLLGKGDMLFVENGAGKSIRLQGAFVSDEEIERITDYARTIAEPEYAFEQEQLLEQISHDDHEDELLQEAIEFVVSQNSASTSLLQRHFKIGYNRAARLMDDMENRGIIAQQNGSKPRDVLISEAQIET